MILTPEIIKRYKTFWAHEDTDRPILNITVRDKNAVWDIETPKTAKERWENLEYRYAASIHGHKASKGFGEHVPHDWVNFGPGCLAAMIGSDYLPLDTTIWFGEEITFLKNWDNLKNVCLRDDSPMYNLVANMTQLLLDRNDGSYLVGMSDLGGNLDILASLRNTMVLLMDVNDNPELVLKAVGIIDELWMAYYKKIREMMRASGQYGHTTWLGLWCETSYFPLQCDFGAMISPDDFSKFAMPSLKRISDFLDHSIFHLDGPGMICHLDQLLSMDRLDGIQWVEGAGNPPPYDECWFPMYEKIQAAGKALVLTQMWSAEKVLEMCRNFSPKGFYMGIEVDSAEEAEELLVKATELSRGR